MTETKNTLNEQIHRLNVKSQSYRAIIYKPILKVLTKLGLSAISLTNFRLVLGIIFLVWFYNTKQYNAPAIFVIAILILDTFDGALARYQNKFSDRGKFLDILVDKFVYLFIIFTFFKLQANTLLVAYHLLIIEPTYLLAIIKKEEFSQTDWLIKPYAKLSYLKIITLIPYFIYIFLDINRIQNANK